MPTILTMSGPINVSLQPGDRIYAVNTDSIGGFLTADLVGSDDVIFLGICAGTFSQFVQDLASNPQLQPNQIYIDPTNPDYQGPDEEIPSTHSFIMFSKDNRANLGDVRGYYAEVELRNSSKTEAELFSVAMEVSESSK